MHAIVSGAAGAATLTLTHEIVRQLVPGAPRLDKLGMQSLAAMLRFAGVTPPRGDRLRGVTLAGDLLANTLYFAPVASARHVSLLRGVMVGVAAGLGAVFLTPALGLAKRHRGVTVGGKLLTVGLYALGGLATAAMSRALRMSSPQGASRVIPS